MHSLRASGTDQARQRAGAVARPRLSAISRRALPLWLALLVGCASDGRPPDWTQRWLDSYHLGAASIALGDTGSARLHLEKSLHWADQAGGRSWPMRAASLELLSHACLREHRLDRAIRYLREAAALRGGNSESDVLVPDRSFQLASHFNALSAAQSLVLAGRDESGEALHQRYLNLTERLNPRMTEIETGLPARSLREFESAKIGIALLRVGKPKRALPHLEVALARRPLKTAPRTHGWVPIVLDYADALEYAGRVDEAEAQRQLVRQLGSGPDYMDNVRAAYDEGAYRAWDPSTLPFRIFAGSAPLGWPNQDALREITRAAAAEWADVVRPGVPSFEFESVQHPSQADIEIVWTPQLPDGQIPAGHASSQIDRKDKRIVKILIHVAVGPANSPVSLDHIQHVVRHEIGHAIGLQGHSPHPGDLMYPSLDRGASTISPRDIATLKNLFPCKTQPGTGVKVYRRKQADLGACAAEPRAP